MEVTVGRRVVRAPGKRNPSDLALDRFVELRSHRRNLTVVTKSAIYCAGQPNSTRTRGLVPGCRPPGRRSVSGFPEHPVDRVGQLDVRWHIAPTTTVLMFLSLDLTCCRDRWTVGCRNEVDFDQFITPGRPVNCNPIRYG